MLCAALENAYWLAVLIGQIHMAPAQMRHAGEQGRGKHSMENVQGGPS